MENWVLKSELRLEKEDVPSGEITPAQAKVKVTHVLLTDEDLLLYKGITKSKYPKTIGRAAVGIVVEAGEECYGIEKGMRVYLEPMRPCGECLECKRNNFKKCSSPISAGVDFDGFLKDFVVCDRTEIEPLPPSVSDVRALATEAVGVAERIFDSLTLRDEGKNVAVIGADFRGNLIAQVLKYHNLSVTVIDNDPENVARAKKDGIGFAFSVDDKLPESIRNVTSGRLYDAVIYSFTSHISLSTAIRLASVGSTIILTSPCEFETNIDSSLLMSKHLTLHPVTMAYNYTDEAINLLTKDDIDADLFEKEILSDCDPVSVIKEKAAESSHTRRNKLTILKMVM